MSPDLKFESCARQYETQCHPVAWYYQVFLHLVWYHIMMWSWNIRGSAEIGSCIFELSARCIHMMDAAANSAIAQLICISICTWLCICVYDFSVFVICRSLCLYFHLWWPWYIFEQVWRWRLAQWWPCRVEDLLWCLLEPLFMGKAVFVFVFSNDRIEFLCSVQTRPAQRWPRWFEH